MAILKHTGAFSGRLGTVVGYRRHEKNFLRKAPRRTAPPTEKELVNRYCFKLVQEWLHPIQEFINQGFRNCGRSTAANAARSHLHHHALQRQGYASVIDPFSPSLTAAGFVPIVDGEMVWAAPGMPDMRVAIGYALHHPDRADLPIKPLDLVELGQLTFADMVARDSTGRLWLYPGNGSGLSPRIQIGHGFNIFTMIAQ
mgnify:CR=1 FL=1